MMTEQQIAAALEGKFYSIKFGEEIVRTVDRNYSDPTPAEKPLRDWVIVTSSRPNHKIAHILEVVSAHFGIPVREIIGPRRSHEIVMARHVAVYLASKYTDQSLGAISRRVGKKDHTMALYASAKVAQNRTLYEPGLSKCIKALEGKI